MEHMLELYERIGGREKVKVPPSLIGIRVPRPEMWFGKPSEDEAPGAYGLKKRDNSFYRLKYDREGGVTLIHTTKNGLKQLYSATLTPDGVVVRTDEMLGVRLSNMGYDINTFVLQDIFGLSPSNLPDEARESLNLIKSSFKKNKFSIDDKLLVFH